MTKGIVGKHQHLVIMSDTGFCSEGCRAVLTYGLAFCLIMALALNTVKIVNKKDYLSYFATGRVCGLGGGHDGKAYSL